MSYTGRMNEKYWVERLVTFENRTPVVFQPQNRALRGRLVPPKRTSGDANDSTPRDRPPFILRFSKNTLNSMSMVPTPGSRVRVGDDVYEVTKQARPLVSNRRTYGYEVELLPMSVLYPYTGAIVNPDLTQVGGVQPLQFMVWEGDVAIDTRGKYDNLRGEAPIDRWPDLKVVNRTILLDGEKFNVTSALVALEQPHVELRLRRTVV